MQINLCPFFHHEKFHDTSISSKINCANALRLTSLTGKMVLRSPLEYMRVTYS